MGAQQVVAGPAPVFVGGGGVRLGADLRIEPRDPAAPVEQCEGSKGSPSWLFRSPGQEVADGGDARADRPLADVAEAEDKLRGHGRAVGAERAHAVQADGALPRRGWAQIGPLYWHEIGAYS